MSYSLARLEGRAEGPTGTRRSKRTRHNVPKHLYGQVIEALNDEGERVMVYISEEGKICREFEVDDPETNKRHKITAQDLDDILEDPDEKHEEDEFEEEQEELKKIGIKIKPNKKKKEQSDTESEYDHDDEDEDETESEYEPDEEETECFNDDTDSEAEEEAQHDDTEIKEFYARQVEEEEEDEEDEEEDV